jgi:DnaJ-class molecular chaperone
MESEFDFFKYRDHESNARKILGVEDGDDKKEIQKAFRELAYKFHPDRCGENPECVGKFRAVNAAYTFLTKGTVNQADVPFLENPEDPGRHKRQESYLNWWMRTYFDDYFPQRLESDRIKPTKKMKHRNKFLQ